MLSFFKHNAIKNLIYRVSGRLCELTYRPSGRRFPVMPDDHSEVVPLLPIPNRTVKRLSADDSAGSRVKVGHCQAILSKASVDSTEAFLFLIASSFSMLARLQKVTMIFLVAVMVTSAFGVISLGLPQWAAVGAILLLMAYGATLAIEFAFLYRSFDPSDSLRPTLRQLYRAWLLETAAIPGIFFWQQPFQSRAIDDWIPPAPTAARRGTVLVHGFVCNRGLWNRWMRRLRDEGVPFIAVDMEPVFGSIDDYVPIIDRAIAASVASTGLSPVVVAHSMGGLAVRAWRARSGIKTRCHRVVTIGSPHHGTWMAQHSASRNGREMRVGSSWLARLEVLEEALPPQRFVCFWSHCDNIVFPSVSATMPDADNRHLEATPHVHMIHHPAVIQEVLRLVDERDVAAS